jgi:hypothetical protein
MSPSAAGKNSLLGEGRCRSAPWWRGIARDETVKRSHISCLLILVAVLVVLTGWLSLGRHRAGIGWPRYDGAFFSITYPPGFRARASLRNENRGTGYDSVFFVSPDNAAEFYVFSPLFDGEPTDILARPRTERVLTQETKTVKGAFNKQIPSYTRTVRATIEARDGSYTRSYVDIRETLGEPGPAEQVVSRRAFCFRYRSEKLRARYEKEYSEFQHSLEQFEDA